MKGRLAAAVLGVVLLVSGVSCTTIRTRVWMNEGNKLYKAQRYDEAVEFYKKIVGVDPGNWTANYLIAMSYTALYHPGSEHEKDKQYVEEATKTAARRGEEPDLFALASNAALPLWKVRGAYANLSGEPSLELERLLADSRKEQMDSDEAERLLAEGDDDERVRALGHMQSKPLKKYAGVVTQAVQAPRSEFEHVQSLRVAQQLVPKLDPSQRDELAQAIARPAVEPGSDPWYIGCQVLADLGE